MKLADKLGKVLLGPEKFKNMRNSIRISAGLHDLGKCGQFGKKYYVENMVKDGRPTKAEPEQKYKRSDSKPFMQNKDLLHVDHPIRSVIEATLYIELTEEEQFAILYHDGLYGSLAYELKGKERPLQTLLHFADYWSAQFEEGKDIPAPDPLPEVTEDDDDLPFC
jgi:23S rRNA maturation-related 3'-5' exoribonuclease YhaM